MFDKFSKIFWTSFFLLVGLKWYITGITNQYIGQLIVLLPMVIYVLFYCLFEKMKYKNYSLELPKKKFVIIINKNNKKFLLLFFIMYSILLFISLARAINAHSTLSFTNILGRQLIFTLYLIVSYIGISYYKNTKKIDIFWNYLLTGLSLYVILNIVGFLIGINNPYTENLQLITTGSIGSFWNKRISFPFATNFQVFSNEAGLLLILVIVRVRFFRTNTRERIKLLLISFASLIGLIGTNTRTSIFSIIIIFGLFFLSKKIGKKFVLLASILAILVPVIFTYLDIQGFLGKLTYDISFLSRKNDLAEIATLNNRVLLWEQFFNKFSDYKFTHFIGYGAFGQIKSGLSDSYGIYWRDPHLITLHNSFLQSIVDIGYFGFIVFVSLLLGSVIILKQNLSKNIFALVSLFYFIVTSCFDVVIYFNQNITFMFFLVIMFQSTLPDTE